MELKKVSRDNDVAIWKRVASDLESPTSKRPVVNLSKISLNAKEDETVLIPGKILSMGNLNKKLTIAAYSFSEQALVKIKESGSKAISISELAKKNPKGSKVRILG